MITHIEIAKAIDDCVETYSGCYLTGDTPKRLAIHLTKRISEVLAEDDTEVKKQLAQTCLAVRCIIIDMMKLYYRAYNHEPNILILTKQIENVLALDWQLNMADDKTKEIDFRRQFPKMFGCKLVYGCSNFDLSYEVPIKKGDKLYCVDSADDSMVTAEYQETRRLNETAEDYMAIQDGLHCWLSPACWHRTEKAAWEAHLQKVKLQLEQSRKHLDAARKRVEFAQVKIIEHKKDSVS